MAHGSSAAVCWTPDSAGREARENRRYSVRGGFRPEGCCPAVGRRSRAASGFRRPWRPPASASPHSWRRRPDHSRRFRPCGRPGPPRAPLAAPVPERLLPPAKGRQTQSKNRRRGACHSSVVSQSWYSQPHGLKWTEMATSFSSNQHRPTAQKDSRMVQRDVADTLNDLLRYEPKEDAAASHLLDLAAAFVEALNTTGIADDLRNRAKRYEQLTGPGGTMELAWRATKEVKTLARRVRQAGMSQGGYAKKRSASGQGKAGRVDYAQTHPSFQRLRPCFDGDSTSFQSTTPGTTLRTFNGISLRSMECILFQNVSLTNVSTTNLVRD